MQRILQHTVGFLIVLAFVFPQNSHPEVPILISYQGVLLDNAGDPVPDWAYTVIFTIYDNATAGNAVWSEIRALYTENGAFSIHLGSTTSINDAVFIGRNRWLGISVYPDPEMTPRTQLVTTPYAYRVSTIDSATGGTIKGDIKVLGAAEVTGFKMATGASANFVLTTDAVGVSSWQDPASLISADNDWNINGSDLESAVSGNVGIGTSAPSAKLHVLDESLAMAEAALEVKFGTSLTGSQSRGINVKADILTQLGVQYAISGSSAITSSGNAGTATGRLGVTATWDLDGTVFGAFGKSNAWTLHNTSGGTSYSLGGMFQSKPASVMNLSGFGTYWIGGAMGIASEEVNISAGNTIVAGIFGFDSTTGTAPSYGGYFEGRGYFSSNVGIGTKEPIHKLQVSDDIFPAIGITDGAGASGVFAVATGAGFYSSVATPGDVVLSAGCQPTEDLILTCRTEESGLGAIRFTTGTCTTDIERMTIMDNGDVGIGTPNPNYKLDVRGTIGNTATLHHSDRRWKKNISSLTRSLAKIQQLRGVSFNWRSDEFVDMNFPEGKQIGLIAQEVEAVIPEVVDTNVDGYKSVDYSKLVATLIEANKEQQTIIGNLESRLKDLEDLVQSTLVRADVNAK